MRAKPFHVQENQCTQIFNLSSPVISHFKECRQESSFFNQGIEILEGSRYGEVGKLDKDILTKKTGQRAFLDNEFKCILSIWT